MNLILNDAQLLDYNIENQFFDSEFRLNQLKTLSIQGNIYDTTQTSGVKIITSGIEVFRSGLTGDNQYIYMNGHNFGRGKITSFSFPEGIQVQQAPYNLEIEIRDTGNLEYITGDYFSGLKSIFEEVANPSTFIKGFSESISVSRSSIDTGVSLGNRNLGDFSYNHDLDVSFDVGSGNLYPNVNMAHKITKEIFQKNIDFGFLETGCYGLFGANYKRLKNQNIDIINGTFSISESFSSQNFNPSKNYGIVESVSLKTQDNGYLDAVYNASIESLTSNYEDDISGALSYTKTGAYHVASGIFEKYYSGPTISGLINSKISESINKNKFDGNTTYSANFTNNPSLNKHYTFTYTTVISEDQDQVVTISENGNFVGKGDNAFEYAKSGYNDLATTGKAFTRMTGLYFEEYGVLYDLFANSKTYEESNLDNSVSYSYSYSDKDIGANDVIQTKNLEISIDYPVLLKNDFLILGQKSIYQSVGNIEIKTLPKKNVSLNFTAKKDKTYSEILTEMQSQLNACKPSETDAFIENFTYGYNENNNSLNANISWKWTN